jgi:dihydrofolate reductase
MSEPDAENISAALPGSVNVIVACDENRAIGRSGRLPWRISEDWKWFMGNTRGGACVIGRICYEAMLKGGSVNGKRRFFVVTRDKTLAGAYSQVFPDSFSALAAAKDSGMPVWICGGPRIYEELMPLADKLYLTQIHARIEGCDAWMPEWKNHFSLQPVYVREGKDEVLKYTFMIFARNNVNEAALPLPQRGQS